MFNKKVFFCNLEMLRKHMSQDTKITCRDLQITQQAQMQLCDPYSKVLASSKGLVSVLCARTQCVAQMI